MIEGLKLTMTGEEIRRAIDKRIREHERRAEHWKRRMDPASADQENDRAAMPAFFCGDEMELEMWRVDVLTFLRDHVERTEIYRLQERDLKFGELLPEKPDWMQQYLHEQEPDAASTG